MPTAKPGKLRRRRCLNDNKLFQPKLSNHKFCCDPCRKEFHRHGSAFGPMKNGLYAAINKKYAALAKETAARARTFALSVQVLTHDMIALRGRVLEIERRLEVLRTGSDH